MTLAAVNDFSAIKASLERLEESKKPEPSVIVTDGQPIQWVDTVYGMYGKPGEDTGPSETY